VYPKISFLERNRHTVTLDPRNCIRPLFPIKKKRKKEIKFGYPPRERTQAVNKFVG